MQKKISSFSNTREEKKKHQPKGIYENEDKKLDKKWFTWQQWIRNTDILLRNHVHACKDIFRIPQQIACCHKTSKAHVNVD